VLAIPRRLNNNQITLRDKASDFSMLEVWEGGTGGQFNTLVGTFPRASFLLLAWTACG